MKRSAVKYSKYTRHGTKDPCSHRLFQITIHSCNWPSIHSRTFLHFTLPPPPPPLSPPPPPPISSHKVPSVLCLSACLLIVCPKPQGPTGYTVHVTHLFLVCTKASSTYWLYSTCYSLVLGLYQSLKDLLAIQYMLLSCSWFVPKPQGPTGYTVHVTQLFLVCTKASRNYWLYSTCYSVVLGLYQSFKELLALQYSAIHLSLVCTKVSRNHVSTVL